MAALEGVLGLLKRVLVADDGERVLLALIHYTFNIGTEIARVIALARKIHPRVVRMATTAAEKLIQQGREAGQREGRVDAERALVRRQLTHRFGSLPERVGARLDAATRDELARWAERLLDVATLEEVFGE